MSTSILYLLISRWFHSTNQKNIKFLYSIGAWIFPVPQEPGALLELKTQIAVLCEQKAHLTANILSNSGFFSKLLFKKEIFVWKTELKVLEENLNFLYLKLESLSGSFTTSCLNAEICAQNLDLVISVTLIFLVIATTVYSFKGGGTGESVIEDSVTLPYTAKFDHNIQEQASPFDFFADSLRYLIKEFSFSHSDFEDRLSSIMRAESSSYADWENLFCSLNKMISEALVDPVSMSAIMDFTYYTWVVLLTGAWASPETHIWLDPLFINILSEKLTRFVAFLQVLTG